MSAKNKAAVKRAAESFVITFVAVFVTTDAGWWKAPNWQDQRAAIVAILPAAITAAVRAAQVAWKG